LWGEGYDAKKKQKKTYHHRVSVDGSFQFLHVHFSSLRVHGDVHQLHTKVSSGFVKGSVNGHGRDTKKKKKKKKRKKKRIGIPNKEIFSKERQLQLE
jgi:hypothetical protein